MQQHLPAVVDHLCAILPDIDWPVREVTSCQFSKSRHKTNKSIGCYTTKPKTGLRGAWVGFVDHERLERGVYVTISLPPEQLFLKVLRNGFRVTPFGPHPFIKQLITEKEIFEIRKKSGRIGVARKLRSLLKKTYPFKKI